MKRHITKALGLGLSLAMAVSITACSGSASGTLTDAMKEDGAFLTVGDQAVSYDEFRYYFLHVKASLEQSASSAASGSEASSASTGATNLDLPSILTQTEEAIQRNYALNFWSKEQGVEMTEDDQSVVDQYISLQETQMGGETAFTEALKSIYSTPDLFRAMMEDSYLKDKTINEWFLKNYADQVVEEMQTADPGYVRVKHILVQFEDSTEGADHSTEKAEAQEALNKALAGEDFDSLIEQYNDDPGMITNPDGYIFTTGEMVQEFEDAAFALAENTISTELVETSYGYHIIQRLPINYDVVRESAMNYASEELISEANEKLSSELDAAVEKVEVKQGPQYKNLTVNIFDSTLPAPTSMPSTSSEATSEPASEPASQPASEPTSNSASSAF